MTDDVGTRTPGYSTQHEPALSSHEMDTSVLQPELAVLSTLCFAAVVVARMTEASVAENMIDKPIGADARRIGGRYRSNLSKL